MFFSFKLFIVYMPPMVKGNVMRGQKLGVLFQIQYIANDVDEPKVARKSKSCSWKIIHKYFFLALQLFLFLHCSYFYFTPFPLFPLSQSESRNVQPNELQWFRIIKLSINLTSVLKNGEILIIMGQFLGQKYQQLKYLKYNRQYSKILFIKIYQNLC